jgi:hypothetical protein
MANPDDFGSGISWLAHPADRREHEKHQVVVYVRPRLFGPKPDDASHPAKDPIERLFDKWPLKLAGVGDRKFFIDFFELGARPGDLPVATAEACLVADPRWHGMQTCWDTFFKGDGPRTDGASPSTEGGRLNLPIRPTALAWDLTHEELKNPNWARKTVPPTIHTWSPTFLHGHARSLDRERQLQLFSGESALFGALKTPLEALALESWTLPRGDYVALNTDVPDPKMKADWSALGNLANAGSLIGQSSSFVASEQIGDIEKNLAAALSPLSSALSLSLPTAFGAYFTADRHDAVHRGFARGGFTPSAVCAYGDDARKAFEQVFAPSFHSRGFSSELAGQANHDVAAFITLARLEAEHVLSRTGRYESTTAERGTDADAPWKGKDFFQRLAFLEQYHGLLRPLGLILDLRFSWPDKAPEEGAIAIRPPAELEPDHALGYRTGYRRHGARFRPLPRAPLHGGAILDRGRVRVGAAAAFALAAEDQDAAVKRVGLTSDTLRDSDYAEQRLMLLEAASEPDGAIATAGVARYLGGGRINSSAAAETLRINREHVREQLQYRVSRLPANIVFPGGTALVRIDAEIGKETVPVYVRPILQGRDVVGSNFVYGNNALALATEIHAPHPRRSNGFVLGWFDKAKYLAERAARAVAHEANLANSKFTVFDEEDLLAGFMVEVRLAKRQPDCSLLPGPWQPLCWRKETYSWLSGPVLAPFPITLAAQQDLDLAPGLLQAPKSLFATPDLFRWHGGLLSITRDESNLRSVDGTDQKIPQGSWSTFDEPGLAPKLLYSRITAAGADEYQFRVRGIDQVGLYLDNRLCSTPKGPGSGDTDPIHRVGAPYLRSEPLPAPRILMPLQAAWEAHESSNDPGRAGRADFSRPSVAASSEAALAPQGWDRRGPAAMIVDEERESDVRWVVPPGANLDFCDRYGLVTDPARAGSFDAVWLNEANGDFFSLGEVDRDGRLRPPEQRKRAGPLIFLPPPGGQITTPYFPDPAAKSYAVTIRDETEPGIDVGIDPARMFLIPLYPSRRSWPRAVPFRIILRRLAAKDPEAKVRAAWHGGDRKLVVEIPRGRKAMLRLSASPASSLDDVLSIRHFAQCAEIDECKREIDIAPWERWTAAGANPHVSTPLPVTLVHACREPVYAPEVRRLAVLRDDAELQSKARLNYDVVVDARSTAEIEIAAEWEELIDLPYEPAPRSVSRQATADPIKVGDVSPPLVQVDAAMRGSAWLPPIDGFVRLASRPSTERFLPLQETKHYRIRCTANGKTRYGEHYRDPPIARAVSDAFDLDVPNAAPPPPPVISHVVPTFGWSRFTDKAGMEARFGSRRAGGGVRVYFERPHEVSGPGEKIAVLLARPEAWPSLEPSSELLVSRWSSDPLHGDGDLGFSPRASDFLSGELFTSLPAPDYVPPSTVPPGLESQWWRDDEFTTLWGPQRSLPIRPLELPHAPDSLVGSLQLVAHDATFDTSSGRWFVDIVTKLGSASYFPFIRFSLLRFQPCSLERCHLSTIAHLDYAQFVPDRTVTVSRHPTMRRAVRIVVSGPDRRGLASTRLTRRPPANSFYLQFFRSSDGVARGDEEIEIEQRVPSPQSGGAGDAQILVEFIVRFPLLIGERRFAVVEKEVHGGAERTIFADVMDFKRQWPWS